MHALDIIDECVSITYKVQKDCRRAKTSPVKFVGKYPVLHTPRPDYLDDEAIATGSAKHSIIKPGTPQSSGKRVTSLEHLPPGLQISLSSRPNTPTSPLIARGNIKERGGRDSGIPHTPSSPSSPFPITPMGSTSGSSYKKLPLLRKTSSLSVSSSLSSSSRSLDVDSVSSKYATNTNVTDLESRRILRAVENEFKHWWKSHPRKRDDKDERGFFATDLTETYLERRLDKFAVTSVTSNIRQEIVTLIENFEQHGRLPYRVSGDLKHQYQEDVQPMTNYAKEKARLEAERAKREEEERRTLAEEKKNALIEKKRKEKEIRRQQYDAYMRSLKS